MKTTGSLRHLLRLALVVGFPFFVWAEDPAQPNPVRLTLSDCVRLALERNPLLSAAAQDRIAAREAVGESRAAYYPTLGVRGGVSRWQTHAFLPGGLGAPNLPSIVGPTDDWAAGGFARVLLLDSGVRHAGLAAAHSLEAAAVHTADAVRQTVILEVHETFYQLAVAMELRVVAEHSFILAESHLEIAKNRQTVGDKTESDVLRAQVEVDDARVERVRADSLIRAAKGSLNTAMGAPAETPIDID
ncbi:MAG: TolC family protein, partial [Lentisphaerae bacterium]|nr:TolC family protein [Lentisphaerota bacterium]